MEEGLWGLLKAALEKQRWLWGLAFFGECTFALRRLGYISDLPVDAGRDTA